MRANINISPKINGGLFSNNLKVINLSAIEFIYSSKSNIVTNGLGCILQHSKFNANPTFTH